MQFSVPCIHNDTIYRYILPQRKTVPFFHAQYVREAATVQEVDIAIALYCTMLYHLKT